MIGFIQMIKPVIKLLQEASKSMFYTFEKLLNLSPNGRVILLKKHIVNNRRKLKIRYVQIEKAGGVSLLMFCRLIENKTIKK